MKDKKGILLALGATTCCALWGISTPIVKMGYRYIDATSVPSLILWVGIQFTIAGLMSVLIGSLVSRKLIIPQKTSLCGIVKISLLQTVLQYLGLYIGLLYTTSVKGAVLKSTDVFFIMLISSLLFKQEKLTAIKIISCLIGFSGIILINLNGLSLNFNLKGDGLVLLGIIFYSFAVVITRGYAQTEKPLILCSYQMTFGGIVMLVLGAVLGGTMDFIGILPIILGLSAIYAVSYSLWTYLLKCFPVSRVSIFSFATPIFGVLFSSLLLNEKSNVPIINLILSLILVSGGIIIWSRNKD